MSEFLRRARAELARLFGFKRRAEMSARFEEEVGYHVEKLIERNRAAGMSSAEARRAALVAFGTVFASLFTGPWMWASLVAMALVTIVLTFVLPLLRRPHRRAGGEVPHPS